MQRWNRLKTWQKWGLVFGCAHLIVIILILLLVVYNRAYGGSGETGLLILLIDYPLYLLIDSIFPRLMDSRLLLLFFLVFGTLAWTGIGILIGLVLGSRRLNLTPGKNEQS